ncbi:MAG: DUF3488 and transglutaminase-like domain-containing protein, partial [Mariprofundaceae bacterium]|nr:DUF3488 and transglutaminase-like domain-containing protein [Mariprofundaceae bacterium]
MNQVLPSSTGNAERLTLGVLISGIAALALSDFVSPLYWSLPAIAALLRWYIGTRFSLTEMQASFIGWFGFLWVGLELVLGRAWVVAFTDFLLILALAVIVETPTPRNHLHRMLTGLFLMLAGAVLTDSVLYAIPLLALMWFTWRSAICLYGLQQPGGDLPIHTLAYDLRGTLVMLLIALLMFIALPRFDVQSKLQPTQPRKATTGFSDHVQLGDFARELDATVVLRAEATDGNVKKFQKQILGRYWRGVTLSQYSNHGWKQRPHKTVKTWAATDSIIFSKSTDSGYAIAVFREASDHPYIFLPDGVRAIDKHDNQIKFDDLLQLRFNKAPARRLRLSMQLDALSNTPVFHPAERYLSKQMPMPSESDASTVPNDLKDWVKNSISPNNTPSQSLHILMRELQSWTYDLHAPIDTEHPLASFLKSKRGHCELYATTLALAARVLGIPSRVINGYYGGEWNDVGYFLVLREQHAHSWVEVWQGGQWQRMDPTPASRWQLSAVQFPAFDAVWESVKLSWYRYILEFQDNDREKLAEHLITWLKQLYPWILLIFSIIFTGMYLRKKVHLMTRFRSPKARQ